MLTEARNKVLKAPLGIDPHPSVIFYKTTRRFLLVSQEPDPLGPNPEDAVAVPGPASLRRDRFASGPRASGSSVPAWLSGEATPEQLARVICSCAKAEDTL